EKTSVRFVCLIPEGDSRLEPARMAWKRLRVGKQFLKALDHYGQSKWWYFCHGPIPSERFRVQFRSRAGYVDVSPEVMARVLPVLEAERAKYRTFTSPLEPWALYVEVIDPDYQDLWLCQEAFPAERFQLAKVLEPAA